MRYLVLVLLLAGCGNFTAKPDKERVILAPRIWWFTVDNAEAECLRYGVEKQQMYKTINGCAMYFRYNQSCTIITLSLIHI